MKTHCLPARPLLVVIAWLHALALVGGWAGRAWAESPPQGRAVVEVTRKWLGVALTPRHPPAAPLWCRFLNRRTLKETIFAWQRGAPDGLTKGRRLAEGQYEVSCYKEEQNRPTLAEVYLQCKGDLPACSFVETPITVGKRKKASEDGTIEIGKVILPKELTIEIAAIECNEKIDEGPCKEVAPSLPDGSGAGGLANADPASTPVRSLVAANAVSPQGPNVRVEVAMPRMPPTRTRCIFEPDSNGSKNVKTEQIVFEWDPLAPGRLHRSAALQEGVKYQIACYADSARHSIDAKVDFAWHFSGATQDRIVFDVTHPQRETIEVKLEWTPLRAYPAALTAICTPPALLWDLGVTSRLEPIAASAAQASTGARNRGFGLIAESEARELFGVVAEVVAEHVRKKALALTQRRLVNELCEGRNTQKLMRTCRLLNSAKIDALAGSGKELLDALIADVTKAEVDGFLTGGRPYLKPALDLSAELAIAVAQDRREGYQGGGTHLLLKLASIDWTKAPVLPERANALQVALAIVAECADSESCDTARIARMVDHPFDYVQVDICAAGAASCDSAEKALADWQEAPAFIRAGLRVLSPPATMTQVEQVQAATDMLLTAIKFVEKPSPSPDGAAAEVESLRQVLRGDHDKDGLSVLAFATGAFFTRSDNPRAKQILATLGSLMSSSSTGRPPTDDERKARREARKQAIEAVINAQTDRGNRLEESIFSIGSTIGPSVGPSWAGDKSLCAPDLTFFPLMATLGVALDYHTRTGWGVHAELAPINLGGYAAFGGREGDDGKRRSLHTPRPGPLDFITPTALLGLTYVATESDVIFTSDLTVSYLPEFEGNEGRGKDSLYAGILLGVYVPLLDFN
jgi:hypothetical protein